MRLKEFWSKNSPRRRTESLDKRTENEENLDADKDLKYKKSHWTPERGRDPWLDLYVEEVTKSVMTRVKKHRPGNLTEGEEKAIKELVDDEDIVIRPADKGSGIVVMNSRDYWEKLRKEVNDSSTYKPTEGDQTQIIHKKVKTLADNLLKNGYIGKHLHKYLVPTLPKAGYIQGNPKLHKEGAPLRAIISGRGHATQGIAEIAESELSAHVEGQPSYVRDTTDFINKVRDLKLPSSTELKPILFCMDVRKLYPSVPRSEGLAACKEALDSRVDPAIPTNEVLKMIELVLDNNNFCVGGSGHFIQVNGTAIGSKLGRNYACTYLGKWEHQLLASSGAKPFLYLRYIDDIFGIWMHGEESLLEFHRLANSVHDQIDLELRHSTTSVEFLDVRVSILGEGLSTDVYTKPTDSKSYLHYSSDHPSHTKRAIPSGLAMRAKRICSTKTGFKHQAREVCNHLVRRGYPQKEVRKSIINVEKMDRSELLRHHVKKQGKEGVPLVVTYSGHLPDINKILKEKHYILQRSDSLKDIFNKNMFVSFKRGTSLRDILVHKKTKMLARQGNTSQGGCGKNCCICKLVYKQEDRIQGPRAEGTCTYDRTIGCKSRNVIYGIFCEVCNCVIYVGETGGPLYQRMQNHLSSIRCKRTGMEVAGHFNESGHSISNVKVVGLEKVWKNWVTYRRVREQRWMGLLGTYQGLGGLNKKKT